MSVTACRPRLSIAPDAPSLAPDLAHPSPRAEDTLEDARDIVVDVKRRPVEASAESLDFDRGKLRRCRASKALQQPPWHGDLDVGRQRDEDPVSSIIVSGTRDAQVLLFARVGLRDRGIDLGVCGQHSISHPCIASQAAASRS
jgi:hypothetical protein